VLGALRSRRPVELGQISSQADFNAPSQTVLIFDWDDTIFPTAVHLRSKAANGSPIDNIALHKLCQAVIELLNISQDLGHCVIITSSLRPWVRASAWETYKNRDLKTILEEMSIVYSQEGVDKKVLQAHLDDIGEADRSDARLTYAKAKAMERSLSSFYSQYEGQSWSNVISLGDSDYEHNAIKQVISDRPDYMQSKPCHLKRIKLKQGPTLDELLKEVTIVTRWLKQLVDFNGDFDIELASAALPEIIQWEKLFGPASDEMLESMTPTNTGGSSRGSSKQSTTSPQSSISSETSQESPRCNSESSV
jgi:hypothetical protein